MLLSLQLRFNRQGKLFLYAALACLVVAFILSWQLWHIPQPDAINAQAGGKTTISNRTSSAFEQPSVGLTEAEEKRHDEGDIVFETIFVTAPAQINPGLGPLFNNSSCVACHIRNGRGFPEAGQLLVRVSYPEHHQSSRSQTGSLPYNREGSAPNDQAWPVPGLGTQIQDHSVYGQTPEADIDFLWREVSGQYADGTVFRLRSPAPQITLPDGEPLPEEVMTSLRLPPSVIGLGLLEAVPESTIRQLADPTDKDGDGITGRVNNVWDVTAQSLALGRFGLKANQPNLLQQTAAAYVNDMGVTNPLFPEADGTMDIDQKTLEDATFYVKSLAVPERTLKEDPQVQRGEVLFTEANCNACHVSQLQTGSYEIAAIAHQTIHPYTDLLLHDMGAGLADHRPDFNATGEEWRTPPLWGLGLTQTVLPYASYLHDGRARTLEEAILWHGGEAAIAKQTFQNMPQGDRQALVQFLRSL